jgi:hypothetical protein
MRNAVFWDVTPCGYCKNRGFGGTYRLRNVGSYNSHTALHNLSFLFSEILLRVLKRGFLLYEIAVRILLVPVTILGVTQQLAVLHAH